MVRRSKPPTRATVSMKVPLSHPLLALVEKYVRALRFVLYWLKENVANPNEEDVLTRVHSEIYHKQKGGVRPTSKVPQDCYRDAYYPHYHLIEIITAAQPRS
ncbi:hypothetical protein [Sulfodiicoccus acidiphilus]|uniref:hypothetical protein n=1 Tax=Sulfodiicoccus acidiphilus TaxID=1670455 RepID=UPI000F84AF04